MLAKNGAFVNGDLSLQRLMHVKTAEAKHWQDGGKNKLGRKRMAFARVFRMLDEQSDLMGRMLDTLGIRQPQCSDLQSARDLREAAQNCVHCKVRPECRAWLDEQEVIGPTSEPTFCPNYERFKTWEQSKR